MFRFRTIFYWTFIIVFSFIICFCISKIDFKLFIVKSYDTEKIADVYIEESENSKAFRTCKPRLCKEVLRDAVVGKWQTLPNLDKATEIRRQYLDQEIRRRDNWPLNMFRDDKRCGPGFLVEGYRLQALCNPKGIHPCCNPVYGYCGSTQEHCHCSSCTDLRMMKSAELSEWKPEDQSCVLKNFSQAEACNLLDKNMKSITFIGDSLIRHVYTMMLLILTGDSQFGSHNIKMTESEREACAGEFQLASKKCSVELLAHSSEHIRAGSLCYGISSIVVKNVQDYAPYLIQDVQSAIHNLLGKNDSYVVMGVGMHYQLQAEDTIEKYLQRIINMIRSDGRGWPRIVWIEIHGINGFLRIDTSIHNEKISRFNERIHEFLTGYGIPVIKTFEPSKDLLSYDGRHYGIGFNLFKVQMLLNYFEENFERCAN